jgi:aryl-alcohol dehydrogenase
MAAPVKVDDELDLALVAPLGCGVQTGAGAVMNTFDCAAGSTLLVLGGGSVGLSAVLAGVVREQSTIIVVEPVAQRRRLALELGATHVVDPADGPLAEQVRGILPAGVDYVVDTTGHPAVLEQAFGALAHRGHLGLIGVPADPTTAMPVPIIPIQVLGATVTGIVEGSSVPDAFIPELVALHKAGRFPYDKLVTTMPFAQINEAVAVQVQAFLDHFGVEADDPRVNPYGGAIALGHPLASSGVRLMIHLARTFREHPEVRYGVTTMCIGLGMGGTVVWENPYSESDRSAA